MRYIICYDVRSANRLHQVSVCLDGYGDRIQKSVFEALLSSELFDKCMVELAGIIDPAQDSIAAYALCAACDDRRVYRGLAEGRNIGGEKVYVV